MLQGDRQAAGEKGDQNVRIGTMLQLMIDGRMPSSLLRERKTDSIYVNCTYRAHSTLGSPAARLGRSK
jgi:hypothetical protein